MKCIQEEEDMYFLKAWSISLQNIYVVKSKKKVCSTKLPVATFQFMSVLPTPEFKKANLATLNSLVIAAAYQRRQKHPLNTTLNPISIVPTMYTLQFFSVL